MCQTPHDCDVKEIEPTMRCPERATAAARVFIEGLGCPNCAMRVQNALVQLDGVATAFVGLFPPIGTVRYDPARVSVDDLLSAIASAGDGANHSYRGQLLS
ncbi:MAG: heavy-metal-associated domain-containing protein [Gemmatimonadetes bacterium]|nr:heavy-metal-associated domain-containing protein [Gemmatimonadota bacterium]